MCCSCCHRSGMKTGGMAFALHPGSMLPCTRKLFRFFFHGCSLNKVCWLHLLHLLFFFPANVTGTCSIESKTLVSPRPRTDKDVKATGRSQASANPPENLSQLGTRHGRTEAPTTVIQTPRACRLPSSRAPPSLPQLLLCGAAAVRPATSLQQRSGGLLLSIAMRHVARSPVLCSFCNLCSFLFDCELY
jgi:hypothetical protein